MNLLLRCLAGALLGLLTGCTAISPAPRMERVQVSADSRGFVQQPSGKPFIPWGFNYDHDERMRLLEDYWEAEWPKVAEDFREMKQLGANVVRVHLQFGRFMKSADQPDAAALEHYARLLRLAEHTGLHLDVTGLGCYHRQDVPPWYDALSEEQRWAAQARFWRAIARVGKHSPAIFCYDLMNEPVAPHQNSSSKEWLGPPFGGKHFVQWIAREGRGRDRTAIARAWIQQLSAAIRQEDRRRLITAGLVSWSLPGPGLDSGFRPEAVVHDLDFLSVHLYPEKGKVDAAINTLKAFAAGKPVVIEETFPLHCPVAEFDAFFQRAKPHAAGWIGFYWGRTLEECRQSGEMQDAFMRAWLEWFQRTHP